MGNVAAGLCIRVPPSILWNCVPGWGSGEWGPWFCYCPAFPVWGMGTWASPLPGVLFRTGHTFPPRGSAFPGLPHPCSESFGEVGGEHEVSPLACTLALNWLRKLVRAAGSVHKWPFLWQRNGQSRFFSPLLVTPRGVLGLFLTPGPG